MSTSFIKIPFLTLGWSKKEKITNEPYQDIFARTAEIKARISALRSSLGESPEPVRTPHTQPKPMVAEQPQQPPSDTDREQKARELAAMKAKLMGKKP